MQYLTCEVYGKTIHNARSLRYKGSKHVAELTVYEAEVGLRW